MPKLTNTQQKQLHEALRDSFKLDELKRMLLFECNVNLENITNDRGNAIVAFEVMQAAVREDWYPELIIAAREARPKNQSLKSLAEQLSLPSPDSSIQTDTLQISIKGKVKEFDESKLKIILASILDIPVADVEIESVRSELLRKNQIKAGEIKNSIGVAIGSGAWVEAPIGKYVLPLTVEEKRAKLIKDQNLLATMPTDYLPDIVGLVTGSTIPYSRNALFVGREKILLEMANLFKMMSWEVQTTLISGLAGIGKTQIAVEFVHRFGQFFGGGVHWFSFANPQLVETEFANCVGVVPTWQIETFEALPQMERLQIVFEQLTEPTPRLLIFDGVEQEGVALLKKWMPKVGGCRVIVTSRNQKWPKWLNIIHHRLEELPLPISRVLLQQLASHLTDDEADQVAEAVEQLPLALHVVGSLLESQPEQSITHFLERLKSKKLEYSTLDWQPT